LVWTSEKASYGPGVMICIFDLTKKNSAQEPQKSIIFKHAQSGLTLKI